MLGVGLGTGGVLFPPKMTLAALEDARPSLAGPTVPRAPASLLLPALHGSSVPGWRCTLLGIMGGGSRVLAYPSLPLVCDRLCLQGPWDENPNSSCAIQEPAVL